MKLIMAIMFAVLWILSLCTCGINIADPEEPTPAITPEVITSAPVPAVIPEWGQGDDLYRQYIAHIAFTWDGMNEIGRAEASGAIPGNGMAHMDESIASSPEVWEDYDDEPTTTEKEIEMLAKTVWGEARGCTPEEQRLVIWTVFQRVDDDRWGDTVEGVITQKGQFVGYRESYPATDKIMDLVREEAQKWWDGKNPPTHDRFAPTLPYYYFNGDGENNWFREDWE